MQAGARLAERESVAIGETGRPDLNSPNGDGAVVIANGYRLGRVLSRNSSVVVCEASRGGCRYAVKLARPEGGTTARQRLADEYRLASMLDHPNVALPLAWIAEPATVGIVFDYFPGGDLVSLAGAEPRHWWRALRDLARALQYMHDRGFVHRDVKARNVMFDAADRAVLIDFGSCRAAGTVWNAGGTTAAHRRPGRPRLVDPGDDVYAYAVLVREMLGSTARKHGSDAARSRLDGLVTDAISSGGGDPEGKLAAFEAVLESASKETTET